jgi:hypothetical protein
MDKSIFLTSITTVANGLIIEVSPDLAKPILTDRNL